MRSEYRGMFRMPREPNVEHPRVWLRGYCAICFDAFGVRVLVEFIPGYRWVLAGSTDPCSHDQPKETSQ